MLINAVFQGPDPRTREGAKEEPSVAETPTICPVYETANNPLAKVSAMVFYRGLEHLIKAFYLACLILNRSLNCKASKCQCSLNIYIPSLRRKMAGMAKTRGKPWLSTPGCLKGRGSGMMGGAFPLISEAVRDVAFQSSPTSVYWDCGRENLFCK